LTTSPHETPNLRPRMTTHPTPWSVEVVAGILWATVEVHEAGTWHPLDSASLKRLGLTKEEALTSALKRLTHHDTAAAWHHIPEAPGVHIFTTGEVHSAAQLLLLPKLFAEWPDAGLVACCPCEELLVCAPLRVVTDLEKITILADANRQLAPTAGTPLSPEVFWCDSQSWHHLPIEHREGELHLHPPEPLRLCIDRIAALGLVATAGEA